MLKPHAGSCCRTQRQPQRAVNTGICMHGKGTPAAPVLALLRVQATVNASFPQLQVRSLSFPPLTCTRCASTIDTQAVQAGEAHSKAHSMDVKACLTVTLARSLPTRTDMHTAQSTPAVSRPWLTLLPAPCQSARRHSQGTRPPNPTHPRVTVRAHAVSSPVGHASSQGSESQTENLAQMYGLDEQALLPSTNVRDACVSARVSACMSSILALLVRWCVSK